ncbi:MAG: hypothetical protein J4452_02240 [Candidatus Aenigmarchaeota archaeon]|nr:hypothetical protein [Candidatus Aenigmarchaeota archaeon]
MPDRLKKLEQLGLSRNKAKIYLSLLKSGSSTAENIAKSSGVHRRNVYDSLDDLMKMGLVGYIVKNKKRYFKASNPNYFLEILEEEKEKLKRKEVNVSSILSDLLQIKQIPKEENFVSIHKGIKGVKSLLNDILVTGKENLVLHAHKPPEPIKNYLINFHKRRINKKIPIKMIFSKNDNNRAFKLSKLPYTKVKYLSKDTVGQIAINIYGDKISIIMWSEPTGILIENSEIADSLRTYFKILWKAL